MRMATSSGDSRWATIAVTLALAGAAFAAGERPAIAQTAGLYCKDLKAQGYSYASAVAYWRRSGYPSRMDADNNGIPCETVYSAASVRDYWAGRLSIPAAGSSGLSSGMLCKDLKARGVSYPNAWLYWRSEGYPARMDADNNGIPCETVYSAAAVRDY